jgi:hypothetical protein
MMETQSTQTLAYRCIWIFIFSLAMAFVESAVVVYLRWIYYPDGFGFPMPAFDNLILKTELLREAATIFMLASVSVLAGSNRVQRISFFLISFGVWDIFYYVWLKVLLNWPESWLTPDILFLIPVVWIGPVVAPVLISITLISWGVVMLQKDRSQQPAALKKNYTALLGLSVVLMLGSFMADHFAIIVEAYPPLSLNPPDDHFRPGPFRWWLFLGGWLLSVITLIQYSRTGISRAR